MYPSNKFYNFLSTLLNKKKILRCELANLKVHKMNKLQDKILGLMELVVGLTSSANLSPIKSTPSYVNFE
jgi:hypothetical protein